MPSETTFKDTVNKRIKFHNQTTFTPYYRGTPDHWYSGKRDLWIEYKFVRSRPKFMSWKSLLDPLQYRWCKARHAEGRSVWVMVGYKSNLEGFVLMSPRSIISNIKPITVQDLANKITRYCNE